MGLSDEFPGAPAVQSPQQLDVVLVGGFYQDLGTLIVTGVIEEDLVAALYYMGIKETWRVLEPYIRGERDMRRTKDDGSFWGSFLSQACSA